MAFSAEDKMLIKKLVPVVSVANKPSTATWVSTEVLGQKRSWCTATSTIWSSN